MIKLQTTKGAISISDAVFTNITGNAATNCFGVKGMAFRSMTDGLVHLLRKEAMSKGVQVIYNEDGTVSIRLHIIVEHGINITAACRSIMSEVQYKVSKYTGIPVKSVDGCVDSVVQFQGGITRDDSNDRRTAIQADGAPRSGGHHGAEAAHQ